MRRCLVLLSLCLGFASGAARAQDFYESLASAYETNPRLLGARSALRAVNEGVPQQLSNYRPFVSIDGNGGVQTVDRHQGDGTRTNYPWDVALGLSQFLYRGGRTQAGVARAEADVQAQRAVLTSVEQDVLLDAAIAYIDVWRDQSVLQLNINNETVLTRQLEATQDRFEVGELTRTDVAQSEARLSRATADRIGAEGFLTTSRAVFQEVIGLQPVSLSPPAPLEGLPENETDAVFVALKNNPDIQAAEYATTAAEHQVRVSVGELLPELSIGAEVAHLENDIDNDSDTDRAQVLAILSIPLYQQGFVSSQVREDKQIASQRRVQVDQTRRRVQQEAIDAWEELLTARAQIRSFIAETRSAQIALEGVREENSVGARTILDVLDAEQEFFNAQVDLVLARRDEIVANFRVLQTLGRLTAADLGLPVELYDVEADYEAVRDSWFGLSAPGADD